MTKLSRYFAVALVAAMAATVFPAIAQFPPAAGRAGTRGRRKGKKEKGAPPAGPNINGNWAGDLTQIGSSTPYKFEISIAANKMETKYPDLDCMGKLTRVGSSKSYVFFVEIITKGQADKGGRCPDGTITVRAPATSSPSGGSAASRRPRSWPTERWRRSSATGLTNLVAVSPRRPGTRPLATRQDGSARYRMNA